MPQQLLELNTSIEGINKSVVMENWADPYLGTFAVPNTVAKKIVGNSSVYGSNHPMLVTLHLV